MSIIVTFKQKPAVRWAVISASCFMSGFIAGPLGIAVSMFGAPTAAALLVQDRERKEDKLAFQAHSVLLALFIAGFTSTTGMDVNPLWPKSEQSKLAKAENVVTKVPNASAKSASAATSKAKTSAPEALPQVEKVKVSKAEVTTLSGNYQLGDSVEHDGRVVIAQSVSLQNGLSTQNMFAAPIDGEIVLINLLLRNSSNNSGDFFFSRFELNDSQGRTYDEITNLTYDIWRKKQGYSSRGDDFFPGEERQDVAAFRVAPGASGFTLRWKSNSINLSSSQTSLSTSPQSIYITPNNQEKQLDDLADITFSDRHPEMRGRKIRPDETDLAQKWSKIRRCEAIVDYTLYQNHPELEVRKILVIEKNLGREWLQIKKNISGCG